MSTDSTLDARVVHVLAKEPAKGALLEKVRVEQLGGRTFLVGQLSDYGKSMPDPRIGRTFWFAIDEVVMLTEYPDAQSARAAFAALKNPRRWNWLWQKRR